MKGIILILARALPALQAQQDIGCQSSLAIMSSGRCKQLIQVKYAAPPQATKPSASGSFDCINDYLHIYVFQNMPTEQIGVKAYRCSQRLRTPV